jgi:hypothetical protein
MQTIIQHITKLVKSVTMLANASWSLNYAIDTATQLGGDRFEPTREGARD